MNLSLVYKILGLIVIECFKWLFYQWGHFLIPLVFIYFIWLILKITIIAF